MESEWFSIGETVQHKNDKDLVGIIRDINPKYHSNIVQYILVEWASPDEDLWQDWYSGTYLKRREQPMSQALWCDHGGHAFSSKDPGKRHFSETRTVDDGFRVSQVTADMDICGECSEKSFLASAPALTAARQDAVPTQDVR